MEPIHQPPLALARMEDQFDLQQAAAEHQENNANQIIKAITALGEEMRRSNAAMAARCAALESALIQKEGEIQELKVVHMNSLDQNNQIVEQLQSRLGEQAAKILELQKQSDAQKETNKQLQDNYTALNNRYSGHIHTMPFAYGGSPTRTNGPNQ